MGNLKGFDASKYEPQSSFDPLPAGWYECYIANSERKPTKAGTGEYIQLELEIMGPTHAGRKVWDRLNIINNNDTAVQIALAMLSSICRAVGVMNPEDSAELHNKPLMVKLNISKDEQYGDRNEVKEYAKKEGAVPPAAPGRKSPFGDDSIPF